jgi:hypothetical protein
MGRFGMQPQPQCSYNFKDGAKSGLRSPESALYRLSRDRPASFATWAMPLAQAISPNALAISTASPSASSRHASYLRSLSLCRISSYTVLRCRIPRIHTSFSSILYTTR